MKYRALIPIESHLEGVNRRNLKFTNLKHNYKPGFSVRIETESEREGEKQIKDK
jgi:hypothetical protein